MGAFERKRLPQGIAAVCLTVHAASRTCGACLHSPAYDEVAHLPAGIWCWHFGRFDLYRVNPPLVRMVAAVPVVLRGVQTDWSRHLESRRSEFRVGADFIDANGRDSLRPFRLARWACIPFSIVGGLVCYWWARDLYGAAAGITACALWCFSPNILGHAQLISPDVAAAALGVAAGYAFWHWLRAPTWDGSFWAGGALGLAELSKMTWIVLFAVWPAMWLVWRFAPSVVTGQTARRREAAQFVAILALAVVVINVAYGFEGSLKPLREHQFTSQALGAPDGPADAPQRRGNRFTGTALGALPIPLPENYVSGIDLQKRDFEQKTWSFLRGEWRLGGWWYYYLYALAVKLPLGTWVLALLALGATVFSRRYAAAWRDELVLLAPIVATFVLVSSQTGMNHHLRYVLPILPFAFVWISKVARAVEFRHWPVAAVAALALAWSVASSLSVYPHSLSYFNELAGGPKNGHWHLLNSNIDWGQDLLYLKKWHDEHPEARPLGVAYFGLCDPKIAGIDWVAVPHAPGKSGCVAHDPSELRGPVSGWFAVSVNEIHRPSGEYDYFLRFEPVAMIGYSIYIYHITLEEANRVRRELGLPEVRDGMKDER